MLGAEADAKAKLAASGGAGTVEGAVRAAVRALRCVSVGPFDSDERAQGALALLRERGYEPRQREEEGERWDGYWVYVGNLQTDAAVARVMRTLTQAALSDARVMPETEEGRRVSVGLFSERIRAERRARVLQRLGLEAQIGERRTKGIVYWMDLDMKPNETAISTEGLLAPEAAESPLEVRACPAVPAVS